MTPDQLQEVIDQMTEFIDAEQDVDTDQLEKWRDQLKEHQELFDNTLTTEAMTINATTIVVNVAEPITQNASSGEAGA